MFKHAPSYKHVPAYTNTCRNASIQTHTYTHTCINISMENLYSVRSGAADEAIGRLGSLLKSSEQSLGDRPGIFVMVGFIIFPKCLCPDFWDM